MEPQKSSWGHKPIISISAIEIAFSCLDEERFDSLLHLAAWGWGGAENLRCRSSLNVKLRFNICFLLVFWLSNFKNWECCRNTEYVRMPKAKFQIRLK